MTSATPTPLRGLAARIRRGLPSFVLVLLIFAAGALLRLYRLDYQSLWTDEVITLMVSEQKLFPLIQYQLHDASPPLYYLILGAWTPVLTSDFLIRLIPALFGMLALPFVYLLGRELFGRRVGLLAMLLFTIWPLHVYYSQENRYQSLFVLLVLLSSLAHLRLLLRGGLGPWACYVAASVLGMYTHYFMPLVLLGQSLATLAYARPAKAWLEQGLALIAIALAFAPQIPVLLIQASFDQPREMFSLLQRVYILFGFSIFGGSEWSMAILPYFRLKPGDAAYWIAALGLAAPLLLAMLLGLYRDLRHPRHRGLLVLSVLLPIALALAAASFKPIFRPKYFLCWMPFLAVLAAAGLALLWRRSRPLTLVVGAGCLAVLWGSTAVIHNEPDYRREAWRHSVHELVERVDPLRDCVVVLNRYSNSAVYYYYEQFDGRAPLLAILGEFTRPVRIPLSVVERRMAELGREYERMWLVLYQEPIWDPEKNVRETAERMFARLEKGDLPSDPRFEIRLYSLRGDTEARLSECVDFINDSFVDSQLLDGWKREIDNQRWIGDAAAALLNHRLKEPFVQAIFYYYEPYFEGRTPRVCLTVEDQPVNCRVLDGTANYWMYGTIPDELMARPTLRVGLTISETFVPDEVLHDGCLDRLSVLVQRLCLSDSEERVAP